MNNHLKTLLVSVCLIGGLVGVIMVLPVFLGESVLTSKLIAAGVALVVVFSLIRDRYMRLY